MVIMDITYIPELIPSQNKLFCFNYLYILSENIIWP